MSDFAAVRIHSKTISIFSSRPIISRKRWTDCDWSSVDTAARRSRNRSSCSMSASSVGRSAMNFSGVPATARATPKSTSSRTQFSTSSRRRPNVCMSDSTSKLSSGRALKYRRIPARSGDCTSVRNRVSRSVASGGRTGAAALARRALKVTSSIGGGFVIGWKGPERQAPPGTARRRGSIRSDSARSAASWRRRRPCGGRGRGWDRTRRSSRS